MYFSSRFGLAFLAAAALTCGASAHAGVVFQFSKSFGAPTIPLNGSTTLAFEITRPLGGGNATGIAFTDPLPSGLVVSSPNGLVGACGAGSTVTAAAGSASVALGGGELLAGATCNFQVNVTGTTPGLKSNVTSTLNSGVGGSAAAATASLTVLAGTTASVPTLSEWALLLLTSLVAGSALLKFRRRPR